MSLAPRNSRHDATARAQERALRAWAGPGRGALAGAIAAALAGGVALIVQCWLLARVIAGVVTQGQGLSDLALPLAGGFALIGLRALLDLLRQGLGFEAGARIKQALRQALLEQIARLGPAWVARQRSGALADLLGPGVEAVESYFSAYLPQRLIAALLPIAVLLAVFPQDWVSGVILLITAPLLPLFMIVIGKGAAALSQRQWHRLSRMAAHFFDVIGGLSTLRQFGAARRQAQIIAQISESYRSATMGVLRVAFLSALVLEFFATISVAMVAVYVGFRLYYGEIAFLPGLFALLLAPEFYRPLRDMGTHYHARMDALGSAEALVPILQAKPEPAPMTDGATANVASDGAPGAPEPSQAAATPAKTLAPPRQIRFDRVSFLHDTGLGVRDLSFELQAGQMLALVGPSGAGKTTCARLLLGLLAPQSGRILLDGRDLATIDPPAWQAQLGWLPQPATLFAGTIGQNIALAHPEACPEAIARAARQAQAEGFIQGFAQGYAHPIGDGGRGLSGGQIQRIAAARLLLGAPGVIVLDEPGAGLERATAQALLDAIRQARPQAAVLLITHDPGLARQADQLVMLEHGQIQETGAPAQLRAQGGAFGALCDIMGEPQ